MLYTKLVITTDTTTAMRSSGRGDTSVFSILETYSRGYVELPDRFFNEIIQRRQTANIPPQANIVAIGTTLNTYDDELMVIGERMLTPFSEDALDDYHFVLETSAEDSVVRIRATARTDRLKALQGNLTNQALDCLFALVQREGRSGQTFVLGDLALLAARLGPAVMACCAPAQIGPITQNAGPIRVSRLSPGLIELAPAGNPESPDCGVVMPAAFAMQFWAEVVALVARRVEQHRVAVAGLNTTLAEPVEVQP
jgi:hypothetical protein